MQSIPPLSNQHKGNTKWSVLFVSLLLFIASLFVLLNRQYLTDSLSFWQYQPSPAIAEIVTKSGMTDHAKFIFYAVQPTVDGNRTFNAKCDRKEQHTAILGCYVGNKIYIYDVKDDRLSGIREVTAIHEMLHAVYDRLSSDERKSVDVLVEAEYAKLQQDERFATRMEFYARTEPGERDNELHSIIGTEVASISPELEAHYKKYLNDRARIVGFYETYRKSFTQLEEQAKALKNQLDSLSQRIKAASSAYNTDAKQLNVDIDEFNRRAESGDFASQAQFNTERAAMVSRANQLVAQRKSINTLIEQYNQIKDKYNETVTQSNELYESIDSNLAPAPTV